MPDGHSQPSGIHHPPSHGRSVTKWFFYFRRCQRVFFNILRCLCFDAFFLRHFLTEPTVSPPFNKYQQLHWRQLIGLFYFTRYYTFYKIPTLL